MFLRTLSFPFCCLLLGLLGLLPAAGWAQDRVAAAPEVSLPAGLAEMAPLEADELVQGYFLSHAYPNPFNPQTQLRFAVAEAQWVQVTLHDMLGRQLHMLYKGTPEAGALFTVTVDGRRLATGLYIVRLAGADFATTRTITLVK